MSESEDIGNAWNGFRRLDVHWGSVPIVRLVLMLVTTIIILTVVSAIHPDTIAILDATLGVSVTIISPTVTYFLIKLYQNQRIERQLKSGLNNQLVPLSKRLGNMKVQIARLYGLEESDHIDFKKHVYRDLDVFSLLREALTDSPIVLLLAKSGFGKTVLVHALGHDLVEEVGPWRYMYYTNPSKPVGFLGKAAFTNPEKVNELIESHRGLRGKRALVIVDDIHLSHDKAQSLINNVQSFNNNVTVLMVARARHGELRDDEREWRERLDDNDTGNVAVMTLGHDGVTLSRNGLVTTKKKRVFGEAVRGITKKWLDEKGISVEGDTEEFYLTLFGMVDSLEMLTYIMPNLEKLENNSISAKDVREVDICDSLTDYYERLRSELEESLSKQDTRTNLDAIYDDMLELAATFSQMEVAIPENYIVNEVANSCQEVSEESIKSVMSYLRSRGEFVTFSENIRFNNRKETLLSLPHLSTAKMRIECLHEKSPELSYSEETGKKYLETMATDLLQYISDKKLHSPLRLMLDFEWKTKVDWLDLYDWLEKKGSHLLARLMEETGNNFWLYYGFLKHIISSERVVQSVIDAIRKSQKAHRVVAALRSGLRGGLRNDYQEKPQVQSAIAQSIQKDREPWLMIYEISRVEVLVGNKEIQFAMIGSVPAIAHAIQEREMPWRVIGSISDVEVLVKNEKVQSAIAHVIQEREMPWRVIGSISDVEVLVENKEIQLAMIGRVPAIAHAIQKHESPWQVIGSISDVKVLVENEKIQSAMIESLPAIVQTIQESWKSWFAIVAISGVEVIIENKEIQSAIVERIPYIVDMFQHALYPVIVARRIMPIRVLRENRAIQEAIKKKGLYDKFYGS